MVCMWASQAHCALPAFAPLHAHLTLDEKGSYACPCVVLHLLLILPDF